MAALDGKITIGIDYRPCIVEENYTFGFEVDKTTNTVVNEWKGIKALFHCWHPVTGNAIVEYEDGAIHEVVPTQIRFSDNAMSEYAFQEMEKNNGNQR